MAIPLKKAKAETYFGLSILLMLPLVLVIGLRFYKGVVFEQECSGHLKRAADANSIELAEKELAIAVDYLERQHLTVGYTSILYRTPDEDIGFWHENLKTSLVGLRKVKPDASELEKSNILLKLRETLLDHNERGESITKPSGVSIYPNNTLFAIMTTGTSILAAIGCAAFLLSWAALEGK